MIKVLDSCVDIMVCKHLQRYKIKMMRTFINMNEMILKNVYIDWYKKKK